VLEAKEWILPDLVHYMAEMEQGVQQMLERLLARQEEAAASVRSSNKSESWG
jgi:hypothetical protein